VAVVDRAGCKWKNSRTVTGSTKCGLADAPLKESQEYISLLISALPLQLYYFACRLLPAPRVSCRLT